MSMKHRKQFLFLLGNAYFLLGNYADAKAKYSECIDSDPGPELKVRAFNNLALACWWHKNPSSLNAALIRPCTRPRWSTASSASPARSS